MRRQSENYSISTPHRCNAASPNTNSTPRPPRSVPQGAPSGLIKGLQKYQRCLLS
ncbi:hypothetical protein M407DRAFT_246004 [Tulasnella calospora MUT 4182]|uniref:Uncharacterized protein n=1 Tax=Tulasnella calospora MUT 4182 TaxID=1051891 RepID=A0A0C3LET7_9AGAM|nr:hypothetical protein M407DRAFT_246004 [Tulasnella calospora MUT 4182]